MKNHRRIAAVLMLILYLAGCLPLAQASGLKFPQKLSEIGAQAFRGDASLRQLAISESVKKIGDYAFADCENLSVVTIPDSVTEIGEGVFDNCAEDFKVRCSFDSPAARWCRENRVPYEMTGLYAYIRQDWLNLLGLSMPQTAQELAALMEFVVYYDPNGNGIKDELAGAAVHQNDLLVAFLTLEPFWDTDAWDQAMEAGGFPNCVETASPFWVKALVVVSAYAPPAGSGYVPLNSVLIPDDLPAITPSPSPTPLAGEPKAYVYQPVLDEFGYEEQPDNIYVYMEMAAELGMKTLAADCDESAVHAIMEADPSLTEEEARLMFYAGQLDYTQSSAPFTKQALLVGSKTAPADGSGYVICKPKPTPNRPTATPAPTPIPGDPKAYIYQEALDQFGFTAPPADIYVYMEMAAALGMYTLAADCDESAIHAIMEADPSLTEEEAWCIFASGQLDYTQSSTPFAETALLVGSKTAPAADSGYVLLSQLNAAEKNAYIQLEWLNILGLEMPATMDELMAVIEIIVSCDPNGNGIKDEIVIAANSMDDFVIAFQVFSPGFTNEKVMLMLAAGEIESWAESFMEFEEDALIVVSADTPPAGSGYALLGCAPNPTPNRPTATPRPTPDPNAEVRIYVLEEALYALGAPLLEDIYVWQECAAEIGLIPLAADDSAAAMEALVEICGFNHEQAALLLAAGEIEFAESSDPFSDYALVVASAFPSGASYVLYEEYLENRPDTTPRPTATPRPTITPDPNAPTPDPNAEKKVYIYSPAVEAFGRPGDQYMWQEMAAAFGLMDLAADDADAAVQAVMEVCGYNAERATMLLAAGELYFTESDTPFHEYALIVASSLPPTDDYILFSAESAMKAYIQMQWMYNLGLEMPFTTDELTACINAGYLYDPNGNGIMDEVGIVAENDADYCIAYQVFDATFNPEKMNLLMAVGELYSWMLSDTPFAEDAMVVVTDDTPPAGSGYVLLGCAPNPVPD